MEMNTRLQVEHPVTEAITGVDLVAWQLQVAAGGSLPLSQAELTMSGHAFEARLYAEDVPAGFLPATGTLAHLAFPASARIDTGVAAGCEISPWYDPMIAKITVHGPDRATALRNLSQALAQTQIAGVTTNLGFLQRLAGHDGFAVGDVDTGLIARDTEALCAKPQVEATRVALAAVTASIIDQTHRGFALWSPLEWQVPLACGEDWFDVRIAALGGAEFQVSYGGAQVILTRTASGWKANGTRLPEACLHGDHVTVFGPDPITFDIPDPLARGGDGAGGDHVLSPMPGLVQMVAVAPGDTVSAGDRMVVLEAMKMEHVLRAPRDGVVLAVNAAAGDQVIAGATLVSLEPL